jgi:adenylate cyclase
MAKQQPARKLAAIMAADVVSYSRLMEADEAGTLAALKKCHAAVIDPKIAEHQGRIVKLMGDGTLAEFASVVDAVHCASDIQRGMANQKTFLAQGQKLILRIGVHLGDIICEDDDIFGDGVNIAARLEALAEPGSVFISGMVHDAVAGKTPTQFEFLGEKTLKNIEKPIPVYRLAEQVGEPELEPCDIKSSQEGKPRAPSKPSLAVKPFENLSGDPSQDQVVDGLSGGIVAALTRIPGLMLIGDETPLMRRSKSMTIQELGKEFSVRYVLKGGLRKLGNRMRVNVELLEQATGRFLWAETYDRTLDDLGALFDMQDEICEEIVSALHVKLFGGDAARLVRSAFSNPMALQNYYNGEMLLWDSSNNLELQESQRMLEESIRLEPTSVGYATVALAYWVEALSGQSDSHDQKLSLAVKRAQEAIRMDDVTGYPHLVLAQVHLSRREFDEAAVEADRGVSARPSCPAAYTLKASVLNYLGQSGEAIAYAQYALRLTPVHPPMYPAILASAYYGDLRYEKATQAAKDAIDLDENHVDPYLVLAASKVALGQDGEARLAAAKVRKLKPSFNLTDFAKAQPYENQAELDLFLERLTTAGLE